jgi:hypothetical protein
MVVQCQMATSRCFINLLPTKFILCTSSNMLKSLANTQCVAIKFASNIAFHMRTHSHDVWATYIFIIPRTSPSKILNNKNWVQPCIMIPWSNIVRVNLSDIKIDVLMLHLIDLPNCIIGFHIVVSFLNSITSLNLKHSSLFKWCSYSRVNA